MLGVSSEASAKPRPFASAGAVISARLWMSLKLAAYGRPCFDALPRCEALLVSLPCIHRRISLTVQMRWPATCWGPFLGSRTQHLSLATTRHITAWGCYSSFWILLSYRPQVDLSLESLGRVILSFNTVSYFGRRLPPVSGNGSNAPDCVRC